MKIIFLIGTIKILDLLNVFLASLSIFSFKIRFLLRLSTLDFIILYRPFAQHSKEEISSLSSFTSFFSLSKSTIASFMKSGHESILDNRRKYFQIGKLVFFVLSLQQGHVLCPDLNQDMIQSV